MQNPDGSFGAHSDRAYTNYSTTSVSFGALSDYSSVFGIVHNHVWYSGTDNPSINHINRYPSTADWNALAAMISPASGVGGADPANLSVFVIDPWGTVREFKYSDRSKYESMTDAQRINGENLPGETKPRGQ